MRKTKLLTAAFLAGLFALGLAGQAFAECAGHTKTADSGLDSKTVVDGSGKSVKTGG